MIVDSRSSVATSSGCANLTGKRVEQWSWLTHADALKIWVISVEC